MEAIEPLRHCGGSHGTLQGKKGYGRKEVKKMDRNVDDEKNQRVWEIAVSEDFERCADRTQEGKCGLKGEMKCWCIEKCPLGYERRKEA